MSRPAAANSVGPGLGFDPAVADAALDRIVHSAHQIAMSGDSMRKKRSKLSA